MTSQFDAEQIIGENWKNINEGAGGNDFILAIGKTATI